MVERSGSCGLGQITYGESLSLLDEKIKEISSKVGTREVTQDPISRVLIFEYGQLRASQPSKESYLDEIGQKNFDNCLELLKIEYDI